MLSRRLLLAAALTTLPWGAAAQESWARYRNTRFGTSIEYPARFRPGRPPDNNDGQSFIASDGATLSVWGSLNVMEHDLAGLEAAIRESAEAGDRITYRARGKNWFVLSGARGDRIFYKRYAISHQNGIINAFDLSYPAALAASYDPIIARISKSFRPGRGYQTEGNP